MNTTGPKGLRRTKLHFDQITPDMPLIYQNRIELEKDIQAVVSVFSDRHQIADWQRGFISMEEKKGEPGANGSTAELTYNNRGREMKMMETITDNGLPHHFHGHYEMPGIRNIQRNFFDDLGHGRTLWRSETEFQFDSFAMRLMGKLMPGMFKKTSQRFMDDFKDWIENGHSARQKS